MSWLVTTILQWLGGGVGLGAFALDWRLGVVLVLALAGATAFLLWLFGKERIKNWISRNFGGCLS